MLPNIKIIVTKIFLIVFTQLVLLFVANAQRANNWYFPSKKSLTFNTNPPSLIGNSQCFFSGAASISDNNGNLLFYSDARRVFNKNHQIMPNGDNIKGASGFNTGSDQALVIPHPGFSNLYYLFTNETNEGTFPTGYYYHLIDMNANGGLGDVVLKNQLLYSNSGMRMTAAPMADGVGYWLITMQYQKKILQNYRITCFGLNLTPIVDTIDASFTGNNNFNLGDMKASTSGNLLTCGYFTGFGNGTTELYSFNKTTGKTNNKLVIPLLSIKREFSPNDKYIYFGSAPNQSFYQFDISSFDSATIFNNKVIIGQGIGTQLGPDGKIYILNEFDSLFSFIEKPNLPFPACNFVSRVIPIEGNGINGSNGSFNRILPFFVPSLLANQNVQINYTVAPDCRTVTLTGKTYIKGNNLTFKWKFGDGDSTVQIVPSGGDTTYTSVTHFYPLGIDTFNVQLFVTSDTVCGLGSAGKKVIVKPPPPTAKFGTAISCNNLTVNFTDSSLLNFNPSITHQWQFFNKNNLLLGSSILQNPVFTFPTLDTFTVRLIARSFLSCVQADTITKLIILKAKPTANFTYTNSCGSLIANFNNTSAVVADTLQTYYWNFGNGNIATTKNPSFGFAAFGTYPVKLVVTSALGCSSDTTELPVIIKPKPIANFIYNNNGCVGVPVSLQDSAYITNGTITQRYWLLPNGISFTAAAINPSFSVGGNYVVKYAVTSNLGCVSDTLPKTIFIESNPIAAIAPITTNGGCQNQAINFTSQSSIATGTIQNYTWLFTPTDSSNQPNPTYSFTNFGNYTIQHKVSSNNGCSSNIATANLVIESNPQASFTNTLACLQKPVNFVNTSNNVFGAMVNSEWLIGNSLQSNNPLGFTYSFNQNGNYTVALKTTTANGCTNTETKTILVEPALASAGNDTTVLENTPFILQGNGGLDYFWQPPTGLNDITLQQPNGKLNNSQQYSVQVTTAQGCVGYDTVMVSVLRNLIIPNAFSPNGDGINETWSVEQLKDYPQAQLQIFSRNGQLVYSARGNTIAAWNGTMNSKPVPMGTYYYVINLNTVLRNKPFTGWVMVVR